MALSQIKRSFSITPVPNGLNRGSYLKRSFRVTLRHFAQSQLGAWLPVSENERFV